MFGLHFLFAVLCHFSDEVLNNSSERSEESVNVSKTILKHTSPDASFVSMTLSYGGWLMAIAIMLTFTDFSLCPTTRLPIVRMTSRSMEHL